MEIDLISLENRKNISLGQKIRAARGYARYLIRYKKAVPDDEENRQKFATMREELQNKEATALKKAEIRAAALEQLTVKINSRAADENKLYGSLGPRELAAAITEAGVPVEKNEVRLSSGPIRYVGEHEITIYLHNKVSIKIFVHVIPVTSHS